MEARRLIDRAHLKIQDDKTPAPPASNLHAVPV